MEAEVSFSPAGLDNEGVDVMVDEIPATPLQPEDRKTDLQKESEVGFWNWSWSRSCNKFYFRPRARESGLAFSYKFFLASKHFLQCLTKRGRD